jgi:hypothetical protein
MAGPVEIIPSSFRGARQPQMARADDGEIGVTFGKENTVYLVVSKDNGKTFTPPLQVGMVSKLALGMRRGPRLALMEKTVAVTAISHDNGNLYCWTTSRSPTNWTRCQINDVDRSAREGLHAMASDAHEKVFIAWLDLRNNGTELWGTLSSDGGGRFGKNFPIYQSPAGHICECCHPSAAIAPNGEVVVMWRNCLNGSRDMYYATSQNGHDFGPAKKLGTGTWPLNGCPMDGGSLVLSTDSTPTTVWRRGQNIILTHGAGPELNLGHGTQPVIAAGTGRLYLAWQDQGKLMVKIEPGPEAKVLATRGSSPAILPGAGGNPPLMAWEAPLESSSTVFVQELEFSRSKDAP